MIDPVRFKRVLVQLIKILIIIELVGAFVQGTQQGGWMRFGADLVLAGILYLTWERIRVAVHETHESARLKMQQAPDRIGLWEAFTFSLLGSDEIYEEIPPDRRRLVVISYTLIALGVVAAFFRVGTSLTSLVIGGVLVLAAVNLVVWIVAVERGEKDSLQTELKLAHNVQMSLMPKTKPSFEGFDIAGQSVPAKEVGGDLFDFIPLGLPEGHMLGIAVVDVSGKGMEAAMAAVFTSGAFASEGRRSTSPAHMLSQLNNAVYQHSRRGHFVAFLLAALNTSTRELTFTNAGQTKPLLRRDGRASWLESAGVHFPLGMKADSVYAEERVALQPGDILFFLTDGFTEAMNEQKEPLGQDRIQALLSSSELDSYSAEQLIEYLSQHVRLYTGTASQHDDMTMVVVKVLA
jgi:serine phosphatase RsbU (regulator of sigma subunit)